MRFTQATIAAFIAATAEARTFAVLRFNGKGLTTGRMDPIVNPGAPSGHVHNIQGGNAFKMEMTDDDPLSSTCTTAKIARDSSNYWTPTLWFKDPSSGELESVEMFYMNVYYFFENDNDKVHAFPKGLRMFVGNPNARTPPSTPNNILDASQGTPQPIQWTCPRTNAAGRRLYPASSDGMHGVGMQDTQNTGAGVGFPDQECDGFASPLRADIHFPSCYDPSKGVRNYKENMVWPSGNRCPQGTIRVPHLFYEVYWDTLKFKDRWTKGQGSSPWVLSNGDPTGYSLHADFINGWDEDALQTIIDTCDAGSAGMDKCPNIPGGLNNDNDCTVPNFVPETVFGKMSSLPGGAKVGDWGEAAPAPAPSSSSAAAPAPSSSSAAGPAPSSSTAASPSTTEASAPSSTTKANAPSSSAAVPTPSTTLRTTSRVAGQSSSAPAPTEGPSEEPTSTTGGLVTSLVSETTVVYTTVTLAPGETPVPQPISDYEYKGCFSDDRKARVLTGIKFANIGHQQVTSTKCVDYCSARGYSIAGTEFGGQCFCGNELSGSEQIAESACNLPCEGDNSEICGGGLALSVYEKKAATKVRRTKKRHAHRHAAHKLSH